MSLFAFGLGAGGGGGISNSAGHAYPPAGQASVTGRLPSLSLVQGPIVCAILPASVSVVGRIPIPFPPYNSLTPTHLFVAEEEDRFIVPAAEGRFIIVGQEDRYLTVGQESRYLIAEPE